MRISDWSSDVCSSDLPQPGGYPVDYLAADHCFAQAGVLAPLRTMAKQIIGQHRQIVIRRQQTGTLGDDAVAIVISVAAKGDIEAVFQGNQALHGVAR